MNLQISSFSKNNFNISKISSNVSFGEYDGDDYSYSPRYISKAEYDVKKEIINEKYNNLRSSYLKDADDLEFSSVEVWKQLDNIEKMRDAELSRLASEYGV